jgi:hypothetical protein
LKTTGQGESDEMDKMFKQKMNQGAEDVWTGNWKWVVGGSVNVSVCVQGVCVCVCRRWGSEVSVWLGQLRWASKVSVWPGAV